MRILLALLFCSSMLCAKTVITHESMWLMKRVGAPTPSGKQPPWKRDASVLAWLDTL